MPIDEERQKSVEPKHRSFTIDKSLIILRLHDDPWSWMYKLTLVEEEYQVDDFSSYF